MRYISYCHNINHPFVKLHDKLLTLLSIDTRELFDTNTCIIYLKFLIFFFLKQK